MSTRRRHGTRQQVVLDYRFCSSKLIRRYSKRAGRRVVGWEAWWVDVVATLPLNRLFFFNDPLKG
jgi:hypothetical protein